MLSHITSKTSILTFIQIWPHFPKRSAAPTVPPETGRLAPGTFRWSPCPPSRRRNAVSLQWSSWPSICDLRWPTDNDWGKQEILIRIYRLEVVEMVKVYKSMIKCVNVLRSREFWGDMRRPIWCNPWKETSAPVSGGTLQAERPKAIVASGPVWLLQGFVRQRSRSRGDFFVSLRSDAFHSSADHSSLEPFGRIFWHRIGVWSLWQAFLSKTQSTVLAV